MSRKVVITGMGMISCLGTDVDEIWSRIKNGESGIKMVTKFDTTDHLTKFGGEITDFDPLEYIDKKLLNRMDPFDIYSMSASVKALKMAGLYEPDSMTQEMRENVCVLIGSGIGGMDTYYENCVRHHDLGARKVRPTFITTILANMTCGRVAARFGFMGMNYSISSACATSSHTLQTAFDAIRLGNCDIALAGGCEGPMASITFAGFTACKALSTDNENYKTASKPFDKNRCGFVMSEGSAVLVLESEESAKKRGANILAELSGAGASCDAYDDVHPREDSRGVELAMRRALKTAGIDSSSVDYVNTHGTSTPAGDVAECRGVSRVLGTSKDKVLINSTKSLIGHSLGAAGGMEAIICVKSLQDQIVHISANITELDPLIDLPVAMETRSHKMEYVMSNSFGFGGHNCSLVFKKY